MDFAIALQPRSRPRWPGWVSLAFGILTPITVALGIVVAIDDSYSTATTLAYLALGTSALAVVAGLVAIIGGWARGPGAAGLTLGVIANPLVLLYGLRALGGL